MKGKSQKPKTYKKTKNTKPKVSYSVKAYVKNTIHKAIEDKYHLSYASNQSIGSPYILSLVPTINQGNQGSQRVGNNVTLKYSYIEFMVNNAIYNITTNPYGGPCHYRYFIISQRKENSTTFDSGGFFEINNSSINIQNNHLDQVLKPNEAKYKIHKSGRFVLGTTSTSTNFPAANSTFSNNVTSITKKINITKYFNKKIKYDDGGTTPTNSNLWMLILPTYANGSTVSGYSPGNISYGIHHKYEDS